jgi:NADPH2:quinone reductase
MTHAIRVHETGGPEVMRYEEVAVGPPGPGEARIRHTAIGVNFIDVYQRSGLYPLPLPFIPGSEAAGVVEAVGAGVSGLKAGDRVAYVIGGGGYAAARLAPADRLVRIPDGVDDRTAAAMMLKGMTVRYLLRATFPVGPSHMLLFHAAAGGVGLIAGQWARHLGVPVIIGTVGSEEKAALARAHGYTHVIDYSRENFAERVKEITGGRGVDVVYDSIGRDTFPASLDCLKPRGLWVTFGQSSGALPPVDTGILARKGSLFMTRPTIFSYIATREDLAETAKDLFEVVGSGAVTIEVNQEYALKDAAGAHRDLEGRRTTGSTVLVP